MRVLMISADRSERGILFPGSDAFKRQEAYAKQFGNLDVIGFSLAADGAREHTNQYLRILPTSSSSRWRYGIDVLRIAKKLQKPDVVTVQDPFETGLVGWWIARRFGLPLHVQVHTDFLSPEYARLSLLNRIRTLIAGFVLRRAARIRVVSKKVKQAIEAKYALSVPITTLPIFVDIEKFKNAGAERLAEMKTQYTHALLVVARNAAEKNIALAIDAFRKSAPKDACLIICGDVEKTIDSSRIYHVRRDPAQLYKVADLVLVPSKYEGYGLVIVEALAAGRSVLATDVGIAREAGAIVTTEEKFADALAEWFKSGPRTGELKGYPYKNFEDYVRAYCTDIAACANAK